ncbi:hypothetical protein SAMN03159343_0788 [Klenkia marina]|uniref:Protein RecA n=1 Tax=Klenkia marina TaxID=1960309 RepID=A0A1G4XF83_9ACTN|nr:hypothetical protein [Klenkia marina]SCX39795.1 hypothetical protein SAMN03159343_0788 [Klenkia marina]
MTALPPDLAERLAAARSAVAAVDSRFGSTTPRRPLETVPGLAPLLPGGALHTGAVYSVLGSVALATALLAGPSAAGEWCGVVGVPGFGAEAAAGMGVDLARTVLVPDPGTDPVGIVDALVGALTVVLVGLPRRVAPGEASRLTARLRQRGAALVVHAPHGAHGASAWPQTEAQLTVTGSEWRGLGEGHGHLTGRIAAVAVQGRRAGRAQHTRMWLPDAEGRVRPALEPAAPQTSTPSTTPLTRVAG